MEFGTYLVKTVKFVFVENYQNYMKKMRGTVKRSQHFDKIAPREIVVVVGGNQ
jgi:hypothetical protein